MNATWQIGETYQDSHWAVEIDPANPTQFLRLAAIGDNAEKLAWNACAVKPLPNHQLRVEEVYVRGSDLIAKFQQSPQDSFAFEVNYRLLGPEALGTKESNTQFGVGLELWVSIHTQLLDVEPEIEIQSQLNSPIQSFSVSELLPEFASVPSQTALLASPLGEHTAVWMIEPTDLRNVVWLSDSGEQQGLHLFGHFMEKGVIRRARMRFMLLSISCEKGELKPVLKAAYQEFANSPLPLTA